MSNILRLSFISLVAVGGVALLVLAGVLVGGFFVENWSPDWNLGDSIAAALREPPPAVAPELPAVPAIEAIRNGIAVWLLAVATPLAWYLAIWAVWGRDPLAGVAFPRFYPPKGLSPASLRQIVGMAFDEKAMAAELLSLAVRGHVSVIRTRRDLYGLRRTGKGTGELTAAERRLMAAMFRGVGEVVIGSQQGVRLRVAMETFQKHLEDELEGPVYATNVGAALSGVVVGGGAITAAAMTYRDAAMQNAELAMAGIALLAIVAMNLLFYKLMKAPTRFGRGILDEIAGFRMFLATAEHERIKMADAPEMTDHLYATYLPYALALDLELAWSDQFSFLLERAIPDPMDYDWYAGTESVSGGLVGMARSVGAAIAGVLEEELEGPR